MRAPVEAYGQFVLQPRPATTPEGWAERSSGRWSLSHHPALPVLDLVAPDGTPAGWLLGWVVSPSGRLLSGPVTLPGDDAAGFEAALASWGGRFAAVLLRPGVERLYLDAAGTLAAVYRPGTRRVASTVSMALFDEPDHPVFARPLDAFPAAAPNQYFPAGLTATPEISRLLPNHYLDLASWEAVRHHPREVPEQVADHEVGDLIDEIVDTLVRTIDAVFAAVPTVAMGLTAGRETRTLLACARPHLDRAELITFDYRRVGTDRFGRSDVFACTRLAPELTIPRHRLVVEDVDAATKAAYLWRIGYAAGHGKARDFDVLLRRHADLRGGWLTGFAGELGRALYWRPEDAGRTSLTVEELQARMRLQGHPEFTPWMAQWLAGVPAGDVALLVDLAMLELRVGGWASAHLYGTAPFALQVMPFAHRRAFDAMARLPVAFRHQERMNDEILRRTWPELAAFPFEGFTGPRLWLEQLRHALGSRRRTAAAPVPVAPAPAPVAPAPAADEVPAPVPDQPPVASRPAS